MRISLTVALSLLLVACGDGSKKLPVGSTCAISEECSTGLCVAGECLDPKGDDDGDGLINELEASQGSNPKLADSDGDGESDPVEYDGARAIDTDGDGVIDALESQSSDRDYDCLTDELDRYDEKSDGASSDRIAELCFAQGVCAAEGATLAVMCREGLDTPACEYADVPGFETDETSCDTLDNDCDGQTDEGCDSLAEGLIGHWRLDGDGLDSGPNADHGTVTGATPAPDRFGVEGQAMRFSELGDRIIVRATEHPTGEVSATYTIWVRPDRGHVFDTLGVFSFGEVFAQNKRSGLVLLPGRGCALYVGESNDVKSDRACLPGGHWSFLVLVKTGRKVDFYWDGRLVSTANTGEGQNLEQTDLAIGLSKSSDSEVFEQFYGVLDDFRVYGRALTTDEIQRLYRENDIADVGSKNRPAQHCLHVRDAAGVKADGKQWVDVDGDGEEAPFEVVCDMTTDGGGWTLAWVYGFTNFDNFQDPTNAVTPRPDWPAPAADVAVSTTPPTGVGGPGAIPWRKWREFGNSFLVASDLTDWIACDPGEGSLTHGLSGWANCRSVKEVTASCDGVVPNGVYFDSTGPQLVGPSLFFYFDGAKTDRWPTHDPCGLNSTNQVPNPARRGGAVLLRPTDAPIHWPRQCNAYQGVSRSNGQRVIDPDGVGGRAPFVAECRFDIERGGWTRLSEDVLTAMGDRGDEPREFLYEKDNAFYRSPVTRATWGSSFTEVTGLWWFSARSGDGAFRCAGGANGDYGVGCGNGFAVDLPDEKVLPSLDGGGFDADAGTATVCEGNTDVLGTAETCEEDVSLWVRARSCMTDEGSLLGDGGFDELAAAAEIGEPWNSPCWWAFGPTAALDRFTLDMNEVRPGGRAPSLRAENPTVGNPVYALNVVHRQVSVVAGRTYTFSFWAKASARRSIRVFVQPTTFDDHAFYEDVTIEPEWREYKLDFAPRRTFWDTQLDFQLAESSTETVWLDDIRLEDMGPSPCGPSPDGNLVGNGSFTTGRTCWGFFNSRLDQLSSFRVDPAGGPAGEPAGFVEVHGPVTEVWHSYLVQRGIQLDRGYRYRLSFKARASFETRVYMNLSRWDLGLRPWLDTEYPVGTQWRTYSFDFHSTESTPQDGARLEFLLGKLGVGRFWVTDIRLERLEATPCGALTGLSNADWSLGLTCWEFEWHWPELDLYAGFDPLEGGALDAAISDNEGAFDYTARLVQKGIQLTAGNGYALEFRSKGQAARRGYTNLQEWPVLHMNRPLYFGTEWKKHEVAFIQPAVIGPAGAKLEIGFGGPLATGSTWFDDVVLRDFGPSPCAKNGSNILANGTFEKSHLCWEVNGASDATRFEAISDFSIFRSSAPSMRFDFEVLQNPQFVGFTQRGLTLTAGLTYEIRFSIRSNVSTMASFSVHDEVHGNLSWNQFNVGLDWITYTFQFRPTSTTAGRVFAELQYQQPTSATLWLDDVSIVPVSP